MRQLFTSFAPIGHMTLAALLCTLPHAATSAPATPPEPVEEAASAPSAPASAASEPLIARAPDAAASEASAQWSLEPIKATVTALKHCEGKGGRGESWSHRASNTVLQVAQGSFLARVALAAVAGIAGRSAGNAADGAPDDIAVCVHLKHPERDQEVVVKTNAKVTQKLPVRIGQTYDIEMSDGQFVVAAFKAAL